MSHGRPGRHVRERRPEPSPRGAELRTDICGFLGYSERGPLDRPVKLESWRQFLDAFGPPLPYAHTGHAVRLFFENGGAACYMMRIADPVAAAAAGLDLGGAATLTAAFSAIAATRVEETGPRAGAGAATLARRLGQPADRDGRPGRARRHPHQTQPAGRRRDLAGGDIAGFGPGSWVRLVQDGDGRLCPRAGARPGPARDRLGGAERGCSTSPGRCSSRRSSSR